MAQEQRKDGKAYQDDYKNALLKVALIEARVQKRVLALCKANPTVVIDDHPIKRLRVTGQEFYEGISSKTYATTTEDCLVIIIRIEQHLAAQHPHKQLNLYKDDV